MEASKSDIGNGVTKQGSENKGQDQMKNRQLTREMLNRFVIDALVRAYKINADSSEFIWNLKTTLGDTLRQPVPVKDATEINVKYWDSIAEEHPEFASEVVKLFNFLRAAEYMRVRLHWTSDMGVPEFNHVIDNRTHTLYLLTDILVGRNTHERTEGGPKFVAGSEVRSQDAIAMLSELGLSHLIPGAAYVLPLETVFEKILTGELKLESSIPVPA